MKRGNRWHDETAVAAIITERIPGFEYVGGYTGTDGYADIRCRTCGDITRRSWGAIRHGKVICRTCQAKTTAELKAKREAEKQAAQNERERAAQEARANKPLKPVYKIVCAECGKTFETTDSKRVYCSPECRKRRVNRKSDQRLSKYGQKENGITLAKLYRRDRGICYICGRTCDLNDKTTDERGTIICGDTYPSIEHVIPLSLGGPNTWDNVRLACRGCNTKKSKQSDIKICADGRLAINF